MFLKREAARTQTPRGCQVDSFLVAAIKDIGQEICKDFIAGD